MYCNRARDSDSTGCRGRGVADGTIAPATAGSQGPGQSGSLVPKRIRPRCSNGGAGVGASGRPSARFPARRETCPTRANLKLNNSDVSRRL